MFPPDALDKAESLEDVAGYLGSWIDMAIVRHSDNDVFDQLARYDVFPVINAMTDVNHPCEILADLFAISRTRDPGSLRFVFVGADGNIARAWQEAAHAFGLDLVLCCPDGLAAPGARRTDDLRGAIATADVILTDAPGRHRAELAPFSITGELLDTAPAGA